MPVYMVERILPGATVESVHVLQHAVEEVCGTFVTNGKPVRYLRSTFTPGESRCRCVFEAPTAELVRDVNEAAQVPYIRIFLAVELPREVSPDRPP
jgi:Protein of unknown function (DUF4242)